MTIATRLRKMMHEISLFYRWSISDDAKIELARRSKMMVWTLYMMDKIVTSIWAVIKLCFRKGGQDR